METRDPLSKLVFELAKLPGIGEKTAARLTHYILKQDESFARSLADALVTAKEKIRLCERCFTLSEQPLCAICADARRDASIICVVEKPSDVFSIEQSGAYRGGYHVLHGLISPLDGIGPDDLKLRELLERIALSEGAVREVVLATNPSVEGEATALYITRLLKPLGIKVTKLAHGIPVGGAIEHTDRQTLGRALLNRTEQGS